jgi:hypothetical protein
LLLFLGAQIFDNLSAPPALESFAARIFTQTKETMSRVDYFVPRFTSALNAASLLEGNLDSCGV